MSVPIVFGLRLETVRERAQRLGIPDRAIREQIRVGELPAIRTPNGHGVRIVRDDVDDE